MRLTVDEIVIRHQLIDNPDQLHVTPDNVKIYFLTDDKVLHCIEAPEGSSYENMSEEELNDVLIDHLEKLLNN
jgi:hypothetical protein